MDFSKLRNIAGIILIGIAVPFIILILTNLDFGSMVKIDPLIVNDVEPLKAEIESFVTSIQEGGDAAVSAEDGFAAVEMAERITNAVREQDWGRSFAEVGQPK